mgnify:CR=1 FL=1
MDKSTFLNKAVFPVAGLGTRFLPATKAQPKEMLPVVDKPLIQYAVEEAYAAGVRHMIFVTGRSKRAIEDHFDINYELEDQIAGSDKALALILPARTIIELSVLGIGWLLGGVAGVGTAAFALLIGPSVQFFLRRFDLRPS